MKKEKIFNKDFIKRLLLLMIGLYIMSLGIAFSIKSSLGTSPISSLPYVISYISKLSVGETTIIVNVMFILIQILILRKNYDLFQLLQIPTLILFGIMIDLSQYLLKDITYNNYFQQWVLCIIGIFLVGFGVSIEVMSKLITTPGEGVVIAICKVTHIKFGNAKIIFDVLLVLISLATALVFLRHLEGVREGTIAASIFVGFIAKKVKILLDKYLL